MEKFEIAIIGEGPAGLSAAIYAARAGRKVMVLERAVAGGQQALTEKIENYPGTGRGGMGGVELGQKMEEQAKEFGVTFLNDMVKSVGFSPRKNIIKTSFSGDIEAQSVIIATGRDAKNLGVKGEEQFRGRGVSYCATCDGAFFRNKTIAVIGGGNSALEEAMYLSRFVKKIYLIHRRGEFRAEKIIQDAMCKNEKIECYMGYCPLEIIGEKSVHNLIISNVETSQKIDLEVEGVFIYVGQNPNSQIFKDKLVIDSAGYIVTDEQMKTSLKGVFAAGDIRNKSLYQVVTAVSDGAIAAVEADKYISAEE